MQPSTIKIKCPICSAVLNVKKTPGLESKNITCPVCKTNSKFTEFKPVLPPSKQEIEQDAKTQIINPLKNNNENPALTNSYGKLQDITTGKIYQLELGENPIGRKAISSSAKIQIETQSRMMSRLHSTIIVLALDNKSIIHHFVNSQNKNDSYINNQKVCDDDKFVLASGDIIRLADVELKFSID